MMKYILLILLLIFSFSCKTTKEVTAPPKVLTEEGFKLKLLFQPASEYMTDMEQVTSTTVTIPNMPEQRSVTDVSSSTKLKFGPLEDNQSNMLIVYDEMDMNVSGTGSQEVELPSLEGMKIYGKLTDGVQSIDSIVGVENSIKKMMEGLIEPLFSNLQIEFPNPMKIGDEFVDSKFIEIPIEGMGSSSITTDTKYTLLQVTNNIADLSTEIKLSGKLFMMDKEIPFEGSGSGTMSIDLKEQYLTSYAAIIDQIMNMDMQGINILQKTTVSTTIKTQKVK